MQKKVMLNTISIKRKLLLTAAICGLSGVFAYGSPAHAQDAGFSDTQKEEIESIIKDYIMENPQVIIDSMEAMQIRQREEKVQAAAEAVKSSINDLTNADAPSVGPLDADVTIVEFFDYNCGYCKRALPIVTALVEKDKNIRVVFKDMPILGPTSKTAARWALAAKKQDKYFEYHVALMEHRGPKEEGELKKLAEELGLDAEKMAEDAQSAEVQKIIEEDLALAQKLGVSGMPAFVIGDRFIPGYVNEEQMESIIQEVRDSQ